ncbi:MAG: phosphatase PAP2 family protein [Comamonadaceae bacterium]|nr:MAG: phosphatase PAP2 family protein [Comamonadaceae bacterium]
MTRFSLRGPVWAALVSLALIVAWDASGLDLAAARWFGTPTGFPWRNNHALVLWMHEVPRFTSWLLVVLLALAVQWPFGFLRRLDRMGRVQLALTVVCSVVAVSFIKTNSATSCPWDLQAFGGVARHVSHWAWRVDDGGPGRCFPAGHASAAFSYLGGWFALRRVSPPIAWRWLAISLLIGFALGLGQQVRGAHYMSHTLWTAWICWSVGLSIELVSRVLKRAPASSGATKLNRS